MSKVYACWSHQENNEFVITFVQCHSAEIKTICQRRISILPKPSIKQYNHIWYSHFLSEDCSCLMVVHRSIRPFRKSKKIKHMN